MSGSSLASLRPLFPGSLIFALLAALPACKSSTPGDALGGGGGPTTPATLAVSANGIFFLAGPFDDHDAEALQAIPLAGGATTTLVPSTSTPTSVAFDATYAYVLDAKGIEKVPQAGGAVTTVLSTAADTGLGPATSLTALPGGGLAWIQPDGSGTSGALWATTGSGTAAASVTQSLPGPCALAADGANLYWLDCVSGELDAIPIADLSAMPASTVTVLAQSLPLAVNTLPPLAAAGGSVFWSDPSTGAINTITASGGTPTTVAPGKGQVASILTDGSEIYWLASSTPGNSPDSVWKVPVAGGSATEVLSPDQDQQGGYGPIALDAAYLYFWDNDHATIRRLAR